jgi:hypothetical protein
LLLSTLAEPAVSTVLLPLLLSTLAEPAVSTVLLPLLLSDLVVERFGRARRVRDGRSRLSRDQKEKIV